MHFEQDAAPPVISFAGADASIEDLSRDVEAEDLPVAACGLDLDLAEVAPAEPLQIGPRYLCPG